MMELEEHSLEHKPPPRQPIPAKHYLSQGGYVFIDVSKLVCLFSGLCKEKLLNRFSQNYVKTSHKGHGRNRWRQKSHRVSLGSLCLIVTTLHGFEFNFGQGGLTELKGTVGPWCRYAL